VGTLDDLVDHDWVGIVAFLIYLSVTCLFWLNLRLMIGLSRGGLLRNLKLILSLHIPQIKLLLHRLCEVTVQSHRSTLLDPFLLVHLNLLSFLSVKLRL